MVIETLQDPDNEPNKFKTIRCSLGRSYILLFKSNFVFGPYILGFPAARKQWRYQKLVWYKIWFDKVIGYKTYPYPIQFSKASEVCNRSTIGSHAATCVDIMALFFLSLCFS